MGPIGEFSRPHPLKEIQVLFDGTVAVRAVLPGFRQGPPVLADFLRKEIAHVSLPHLDQLNRILIESFEVVGGIEEPILPVKSQPADVGNDGITNSVLSPAGSVSSIRKLQVPRIGRRSEIETDGLGVADMEIPVRSGGKRVATRPSFF